jgi:hypothetical protein
VIEEAELTLATVKTQWINIKSQCMDMIEHALSNVFHKMRRAMDMKHSTDCQSALDIKEFLLSAVKAAAPLSLSITIPLKMEYKKYLSAPAATHFSDGLKEMMMVLKSISPDGRIQLDNLVDFLCQATAAGINLPPQWMLVEKKQSMYNQCIIN